jgi:hypothetical protein
MAAYQYLQDKPQQWYFQTDTETPCQLRLFNLLADLKAENNITASLRLLY